MSKCTNAAVYFDWKTVIYIYVCGKCRTQFMLPMEKSVTFTGACANEIIPSINRSFVYKAKERCHIIIYVLFLCEYWCWTKPMQKIWRDSMIFSLVMDKNGEFGWKKYFGFYCGYFAPTLFWFLLWRHCSIMSMKLKSCYQSTPSFETVSLTYLPHEEAGGPSRGFGKRKRHYHSVCVWLENQ
jgi:hypothetical protein